MILIRECQRCRHWCQTTDLEAEERLWRVCFCGGRMVIEGKYEDINDYHPLAPEVRIAATKALSGAPRA